jgi:hypothetical protein
MNLYAHRPAIQKEAELREEEVIVVQGPPIEFKSFSQLNDFCLRSLAANIKENDTETSLLIPAADAMKMCLETPIEYRIPKSKEDRRPWKMWLPSSVGYPKKTRYLRVNRWKL